jgi:hypothetical protein
LSSAIARVSLATRDLNFTTSTSILLQRDYRIEPGRFHRRVYAK